MYTTILIAYGVLAIIVTMKVTKRLFDNQDRKDYYFFYAMFILLSLVFLFVIGLLIIKLIFHHAL